MHGLQIEGQLLKLGVTLALNILDLQTLNNGALTIFINVFNVIYYMDVYYSHSI